MRAYKIASFAFHRHSGETSFAYFIEIILFSIDNTFLHKSGRFSVSQTCGLDLKFSISRVSEIIFFIFLVESVAGVLI